VDRSDDFGDGICELLAKEWRATHLSVNLQSEGCPWKRKCFSMN
jgi:hypothetical protein